MAWPEQGAASPPTKCVAHHLTGDAHWSQVQPGCTVVQSRRFRGQSLGAVQLQTASNTTDAFALSLRCCARCSSDFNASTAYFVCINPAGCRESRDSVPYRALGTCECQLQQARMRGQSAYQPAELDNPGSFAAGVIVRDTTPFAPLSSSSDANKSAGNKSSSDASKSSAGQQTG